MNLINQIFRRIHLQIKFKTEELRDTCLKAEVAEKTYGAEIARVLFDRIADLKAAETINDIFYKNLVYNIDGTQDSVELETDHKLIIKFVSAHTSDLSAPNTRVKWEQVKRIKVMDIYINA